MPVIIKTSDWISEKFFWGDFLLSYQSRRSLNKVCSCFNDVLENVKLKLGFPQICGNKETCFFFHFCRATNTLEQYKKKISDLEADYAGKRRSLLAPSEQIKDALRRIYNRESLAGIPPLTAAPAAASIFGGGGGGGSFLNKPSVFGGGASASAGGGGGGGLFGKPAAGNPFGGGGAAVAPSVFGGGAASTGSSSIFGGGGGGGTSVFGGINFLMVFC